MRLLIGLGRLGSDAARVGESCRASRAAIGARFSLNLTLLLCIVGWVMATESSATVWSPQSKIHPGTQHTDWYPSLAITPDGTVWVVWEGTDPAEGDDDVFYSRWNGQSWDEARQVNPPNSVGDEFAKLACAHDGTLWALWSAPTPGADGYYLGLTSRWNGSGWTNPDTVWTDRGRYNNFDFAPVSSTEAWFIREGQGNVLVYHHAGTMRDQVHSFDLPSASGRQPTIAVDSDGTVWAVWSHNSALDLAAPLEWARRVGGAWQDPQILAVPVGVSLPMITVGHDDAKWIVCAGRDPAHSYTGNDIWALRWNGSTWSAATRISDQIQSNDSIQVYNAVSRTPGEDPRAVWVRANIRNYSRRDVLTTAWDGAVWSPVELVGSLADSAYQEWPNVAVRGQQIWVAWMQEPKTAPFVLNAIAVHAIPQTTAAFTASFDVSPVPGGVRLTWSVEAPSTVDRARILRAPGRIAGSEAPLDAVLVTELAAERVRAGSIVDRDFSTAGEYTYWLAFLTSDDKVAWLGPSLVRVELRPIRSYLRGAYPNPTGTGVVLRGTVGIGFPRQILVYGVDGRRVRALAVRGDDVLGKDFSVSWDGRRDDGSLAANGVYFARLMTSGPGNREGSIRIVLVR